MWGFEIDNIDSMFFWYEKCNCASVFFITGSEKRMSNEFVYNFSLLICFQILIWHIKNCLCLSFSVNKYIKHTTLGFLREMNVF